MASTYFNLPRVGGGPAAGFAEIGVGSDALLEPGAAFAPLPEPAARVASAGDSLDDRSASRGDERHDVIVIGAGQAGLSVGYHLARQGVDFVILESHDRIGDGWRRRWDSLRLFSPARYDGLAGMRFPAPPRSFPTKDEMADYLESYASQFRLPVRTGVRVDELTHADGRYVVRAGARRFVADHVVVAAASYQRPKVPDYGAALDPSIRQFHSSAYRNPSQLRPGSVLLVGAGNSGAELAIDLADTHQVWLAGRHPGHLPFEHGGAFAYYAAIPILFRLVFHRLLSMDTPIGRKARPQFLGKGVPLIRVKPRDLENAGVQRVPRLAAVIDGRPVLDDGQCLDVDNVVWCTGFHPALDWIRLPIFDEGGRPVQYRGAAADQPGLYFAGLPFQHSASSTMIHGADRDARHVVDEITVRMRAPAHR